MEGKKEQQNNNNNNNDTTTTTMMMTTTKYTLLLNVECILYPVCGDIHKVNAILACYPLHVASVITFSSQIAIFFFVGDQFFMVLAVVSCSRFPSSSEDPQLPLALHRLTVLLILHFNIQLAEVGSDGFVVAEGEALRSFSADNAVVSLTGSNPMHEEGMAHVAQQGMFGVSQSYGVESDNLKPASVS